MKIPSMIPPTRGIDPFRSRWAEEDLSPGDAESLLEAYSHKDNTRQHILRDFFSSHFRKYCVSHRVPEEKLFDCLMEEIDRWAAAREEARE